METKALLVVFGTVFLAELGDKTQLATLLFASDRQNSALGVFLAASAALVATTALGVAAGSLLSQYVNARYLSVLAGVGFLVIGAWTLWSALRGGAA
jgi:putative Ca2+/H+ antiporter (TMEM165/GDT1 family)